MIPPESPKSSRSLSDHSDDDCDDSDESDETCREREISRVDRFFFCSSSDIYVGSVSFRGRVFSEIVSSFGGDDYAALF